MREVTEVIRPPVQVGRTALRSAPSLAAQGRGLALGSLAKVRFVPKCQSRGFFGRRQRHHGLLAADQTGPVAGACQQRLAARGRGTMPLGATGGGLPA